MTSTASHPSLLDLAKQGNAQAIAALINRQLQPKGITAKAALKEGCLQVMVESAQVPNQQALIGFIRKGITNLEVASIQKVKIYGRKTDEEIPSWSDEFEIGTDLNPFSEFSTYLTPENHAKNPSVLANQTLEHQANRQQPWYEQEINIFLLVLFFWPVGIYLMWKYSKTSIAAKWVITFFCSLAFFAAIS